MKSRWFLAITAYGLLNAAAYACLLPLWEGWDEGYHYGYVEQLSVQHSFPVLFKTDLTREIWSAYLTVPVSNFIQNFTGAPINFSDYAKLDEAERGRLRQRLDSIDTGLRFSSEQGKWNNEAHQAPLPYLFMAPFDWMLRGLPLVERVLWLRLLIAAAAVLLTAFGTRLLAAELGLPGLVALLWVFSSQMFYACSCHVCNDWPCVPVMAWLMALSIRAWRTGDGWGRMGLAYTAALLTKSHFLVLAPLIFGLPVLAIWMKRARVAATLWMLVPIVCLAVPWYGRNLVLYQNLTGMVESTRGVTLGDYWHTATTMSWPATIRSMAHGSLWTGNNSFTSFSALTLNVILLLLGIGFAVLVWEVRRNGPAVWIVLSAIVLYAGGLAFVAVAFWRGGLIAPMPWYAQVLLAPVALLAMKGMLEIRRPWGPLCASALTGVWSYVMLATFYIKLIPMYGGLGPGRTRIGALWQWYVSNGTVRDSFVRTTSPASPVAIWTLLALASVLGLVVTAGMVRLANRGDNRIQL